MFERFFEMLRANEGQVWFTGASSGLASLQKGNLWSNLVLNLNLINRGLNTVERFQYSQGELLFHFGIHNYTLKKVYQRFKTLIFNPHKCINCRSHQMGGDSFDFEMQKRQQFSRSFLVVSYFDPNERNPT